MKLSMKKMAVAAVVAGTAAWWGCNNGPSSSSTSTTINATTTPSGNALPQDVMVKCPLDSATFNSWFLKGKATENGAVIPANSVAFVHDSNCNFYRWSEQMFLWITSGAEGYGGRGTVLESPLFYTIQADSENNFNQSRRFVPHVPGTRLRALSHFQQLGPNRLPMVKDKVTGKFFEIETDRPKANEKPMVKNAQGKTVAVSRIEKGANGVNTLFDAQNKPIEGAKAVIRHKIHPENIAHDLGKVNGMHVYLTRDGRTIESETGQATQDILMSQCGSLVYYIIFTNDVYAFYSEGVYNNMLNGGSFPTTAGGRDSICAFARKYHDAFPDLRSNGVLPDSNALAIELKTSWVIADSLPDKGKGFVTIDATIPTYKKVGDSIWMLSGEQNARLAMVGLHVVGSAAGHPEMIWATFEHLTNTPDTAYQYLDKTGAVKVHPQESGSNWLFSNNGMDPVHNISLQHWSNSANGSDTIGDTIYGTSTKFLASNTLMVLPWGSAFGVSPNAEDGSSAASNSEVISLNNAVHQLLPGNDLRKNYRLMGATWTSGGTAPNGNVYNASTPNDSVAIGTSLLANSTMETYFQFNTTTCFTCHSGGSLSPDVLSHIYSDLKLHKLPKMPPTGGK